MGYKKDSNFLIATAFDNNSHYHSQ